jgi:tRNA A-37 threonylcarbamoyl transferase component Bud32
MHSLETEIMEIAIANGWRGRAMVRAGGKELFSKSQWEKLLISPERLLEGAQQTLKVEGLNSVTIKYLDTEGRGVKAVIKCRRQAGGIRGFFRAMGIAHSVRNFTAAVKVKQYGLPVAEPLAAVFHRRFLFCDESIYISEYVEGKNLNEFVKDMQEQGSERYRIIRELCGKIAGIFAGLHKNNLWHRDAKATNFVVSRNSNGEYNITITDVDGIKQYLSQSEDRQMQGLCQLASSVMGLAGITRTDYLRTFEMYCDEVGIAKELRRGIYYRLAEKAETKFKQRQLKQARLRSASPRQER